MELKFYYCQHCQNIICHMKNSGVPVMCCGEVMKEMIPNTTDASKEKHLPVMVENQRTITVTVGSVEHPMTSEHYIEWIVLETTKGYSYQFLQPNQKPSVKFMLDENEEVLSSYAYCNLHGLWMK